MSYFEVQLDAGEYFVDIPNGLNNGFFEIYYESFGQSARTIVRMEDDRSIPVEIETSGTYYIRMTQQQANTTLDINFHDMLSYYN